MAVAGMPMEGGLRMTRQWRNWRYNGAEGSEPADVSSKSSETARNAKMSNGTIATPITNGTGTNGYWDASMIDVANIDYFSEAGIEKLRREWDTEYTTLWENKDKLLRDFPGQYIIIQGKYYEVYADRNDADRRAHKIFPNGLYLMARLTEDDMAGYFPEKYGELVITCVNGSITCSRMSA
jgi:hypothetical protein